MEGRARAQVRRRGGKSGGCTRGLHGNEKGKEEGHDCNGVAPF
jgi:hypothetical protein